jgi:hypothetical protein
VDLPEHLRHDLGVTRVLLEKVAVQVLVIHIPVGHSVTVDVQVEYIVS